MNLIAGLLEERAYQVSIRSTAPTDLEQEGAGTSTKYCGNRLQRCSKRPFERGLDFSLTRESACPISGSVNDEASAESRAAEEIDVGIVGPLIEWAPKLLHARTRRAVFGREHDTLTHRQRGRGGRRSYRQSPILSAYVRCADLQSGSE